MSKKCVFAGTFDPPTTGHKSVIDNCLKIFDEVVVAVMINPEKSPYLTADERQSLLTNLYEGEPRVRVCTFEGAAVDLLERENTCFYVRGIRDSADFDYENRNFFASKVLKPDLVEIYFPAEQESMHISSSLVRSSIKFDKRYLQYIPGAIQEEFKKILKNKR